MTKKTTKCPICSENGRFLMNDSILNEKYLIDYFTCNACQCIFTENPYWLEEAYSDAISIVDTGIMRRNLHLCNELMIILASYFKRDAKIVDFGAGYGILVRMLRDRGVDAYWNDKYSKNLLSMGFEYQGDFQPDAIVAFEVMEHLVNPLETVSEIMKQTDSFIFSTLTIPHMNFKNNKDWWYFVPESGQHVFLSSEIALKKIAEHIGCNYKRVNKLHIIYRGSKFNSTRFGLKLRSAGIQALTMLSQWLGNGFRYQSKVWSDNALLKNRIKTK
jgi:hypothetical protein